MKQRRHKTFPLPTHILTAIGAEKYVHILGSIRSFRIPASQTYNYFVIDPLYGNMRSELLIAANNKLLVCLTIVYV